MLFRSVSLATGALCEAMLPHLLQLAADAGDAILHAAAVGFELGFTVTPHADAARLPGQVTPEARQPREEMLKLREFNLELAFAGAGALGEDVENERGAVEHLAFEDFLEIAALSGGKFIVENDGIDFFAAAVGGEFVRLAAADEGAGDGRVEFLRAIPDDLSAGAGGQLLQFCEGILEIPGRAGIELKADEENSLRGFAG